MKIILELPMPPSANGLFPASRGKRVPSAEYRVYRARVIHDVWKHFGRRPEPITGPVRLAMLAHKADKRRRDLSNLWKALEDSLTMAGLWLDDEQVHGHSAEWSTTPPKGRIRLMVMPYSPGLDF